MATALSYPTITNVTGAPYLTDLSEPANIQDALKYLYYGSTKAQVTSNGIYGMLSSLQTQITATQSGINVHEAAKAATVTGTPVPGTYAAGTTDASGGTGIGATITYAATGVITLDGQTLAANDRILVKDGTTALSGINSIANGIYTVTTAGAVGVACVLTRATDSDNSIAGEFGEGDSVFVANGTANNNLTYVLTSSSPTGTGPAGAIKIGTDPVTYVVQGSIAFGSQAANLIYASPNGSTGTAAFRQFAPNDLATGSSTGQAPIASASATGWSWITPMTTSGGVFTGIVYNNQPTITVQSASATLTAAQMLTLIIQAGAATPITYTLPTAALMDTGTGTPAVGSSFDWSVINTGSGTGTVTLAVGTSHTITGSTTVNISTSARFRTTRTAATPTWVTYRIS